MSQPFDATLKDIVRRHVADYAAAFRLPHVTTALDVDLSTVSAATDVVLADANPPRVAVTTLDFQSSYDLFLDDRILMYQGLLRNRFHLPVHSVVLLLRPDAFRPAMTGGVRYRTADGRGRMEFAYELVRLWEVPAAELLEAPIGSAVLAVLGQLPGRRDTEAGLQDVFRALDRRLRAEVPPAEANDLRTATGLLMGLRIPREAATALVQRVTTMEESTVYQVILEKGVAKGEAKGEARGRLDEARRLLLQVGRQRFGAPSRGTQKALKDVAELDRLHRMFEQVLKVDSWPALLEVR